MHLHQFTLTSGLPKEIKGAVEQGQMLMATDEDRLGSVLEILSLAHINVLQSFNQIKDLSRPHIQPQGSYEIQDQPVGVQYQRPQV